MNNNRLPNHRAYVKPKTNNSSEYEKPPKAFILQLLMSRQNKLQNSECLWYMDSGASAYMWDNLSSFNPSTITTSSKPVLQVGDGVQFEVPNQGENNVKLNKFGKIISATLHEVLHARKLRFNLFSIRKIHQRGFTVSFTDGANKIGIFQVVDNHSDEVVITGIEVSNGLYEVVMRNVPSTKTCLASTSSGKLYNL